MLLRAPTSTARLRDRWLRWSGRTLLAGGLICLGYVVFVLFQAKLYDHDAKQYSNLPLVSDHVQEDPRSESRPPESILSEGDILGHIEIRRLGVSAAVLQGTASRTLRLGVGHIRGTSLPGMPGNSAFAGHRDTFFRGLKGIHAGDEIEFQTPGNSTQYVVDWARVVQPEDISVLGQTDEPTLTLVTCYPFTFLGSAPKRFVVRAHQLAKEQLTSTEPMVPKSGRTKTVSRENQDVPSVSSVAYSALRYMEKE